MFLAISKHKNSFKKENMGQNRFKKLSKFRMFQLSDFTLTWSNEAKVNSVRQTCLEKHLN